MANVSGSVYGLTILSPIRNDGAAELSHNLEIRRYLAGLDRGKNCPFTKVPGTHLCRLAVLDDVLYQGLDQSLPAAVLEVAPKPVDSLKSAYLVFECSLDGDLDAFLLGMAQAIPDVVDAIWSHCEGYSGVLEPGRFVEYMKRCQVTTTFFFADVNNKTIGETLRALQTQRSLASFFLRNQGRPPAEIQKAFQRFQEALRAAPPPAPGLWDIAAVEEQA